VIAIEPQVLYGNDGSSVLLILRKIMTPEEANRIYRAWFHGNLDLVYWNVVIRILENTVYENGTG
jgi:hypothetical protein